MLFYQLLSKSLVVLDDSIVDKGYPLSMVGVRVRIDIAFLSMRCPACVSDSYRAFMLRAGTCKQLLKAISPVSGFLCMLRDYKNVICLFFL